MKNSVFLPVIFLLTSSITIFSQWQVDTRLTFDSVDSKLCLNNSRSIAASGDYVHIVWSEARNGISTDEIYYKRSRDGGISWEAESRLTNAPGYSWNPVLSVTGQVVHIIWEDNREGNSEIYYMRSTDGGTSWGNEMKLTNNSAVSQYPSLSVSGLNISIVWEDTRNGSDGEIYYIHSTDGGVSWSPDSRLTNNPAGSSSPAVCVAGSNVHVVWKGNNVINYKRSTDGGVSWSPEIPITNSISNHPSASISGSLVHLTWEDFRNGNNEIYYTRSTNEGISWEADSRLTNDPALSLLPNITVSGIAVHVVWIDRRDGNSEIYHKHSSDGGINWGADTRLTNDPANSTLPSTAISGTLVHSVWQDYRDGNYEIYYKRNPTGNPFGINPINTDIPTIFKLNQNYPNPFNPITKIRFQIPKSGVVNLEIYDALGRNISTLVNENLKPGVYEAEWNANNQPSGIYFYRIMTPDFSDVKKMVLIK